MGSEMDRVSVTVQWHADVSSAQNPITQLSYLDLLQSILSRSPAALSPRHLTRYLDALADTPQLGTGHSVWVTGLQECEASSDLWVHAYIRMLRCLAQPAVALDAELVSMVEDRVIRAVTVAQASKKVRTPDGRY
jgi:hypothetical protein